MAAEAKPQILSHVNNLNYFSILLLILSFNVASGAGGTWKLLLNDVGISAMHSQLLINDRVIMYDRSNFGPSKISLPSGACRDSPNDVVSKRDCTAHSIEYDVAFNSIRPLTIESNTWCSSGGVTPEGALLQTGGDKEGERKARMFYPCDDESCDWTEVDNALYVRRWYATNHVLPDGRQIIIGGRNQFNFEFFPKTKAPSLYKLPFLSETYDAGQENNLYPFVFLNSDGNLFIYANNKAILLDYNKNTVVKTYPKIPGGDPRSYPSTGSAVLLPIKNLEAEVVEMEVLVCGGAPKGSYLLALYKNTFVKALDTCARIKINDDKPQWVLEKMPRSRVMGDMILLPNGHVLLINGGSSGSAGWELGREPVLNPDLYHPDKPVGSRFQVQNPSTIPRMYHSTAGLLRDGRVLVGGSNPHQFYNFTDVLFPTELRLEAFSPSYLESQYWSIRPRIISLLSHSTVNYGGILRLRFMVFGIGGVRSPVKVTMVFPSFTSHSFSMSQRLLVLDHVELVRIGVWTYEVRVKAPKSKNLAPPGYYMASVVNQDIPSEGIWLRLQ
ncbi:aldehyde oxidase GLOX [Brassica rapa]|uniref:aldehyde oxidase GLOX n=1 Tax=Brassica campestris TaxID=3711 RepID=UPI00142E11D2|nr:aldehyde oxidase GLOX [Brassica rapa]